MMTPESHGNAILKELQLDLSAISHNVVPCVLWVVWAVSHLSLPFSLFLLINDETIVPFFSSDIKSDQVVVVLNQADVESLAHWAFVGYDVKLSTNTEVLVLQHDILEWVVDGGFRHRWTFVGFGQIVAQIWTFVMSGSVVTFQSQSHTDLIGWFRLGDLDSGGGSHKGGEG